MAGREAYSLYVERPDEAANEADAPLSARSHQYQRGSPGRTGTARPSTVSTRGRIVFTSR